MILREMVEERRQLLINQLWKFGYEQTPDGINIEDLNLTELEQVYTNVKCREERKMQYEHSTIV
jgi:hypothetical protein